MKFRLYKKFVLLSTYAALFVFLFPLDASAKFKDIPETNPYRTAITFLEEQGIIKGGNKKLFRPSASLTRENLVLWVTSWAKIEADKASRQWFSDVPAQSPLGKYVSQLAKTGVIDDELFFFPKRPATRLDALRLLFDAKGVAIPKILHDLATLPYKDLLPDSPYLPLAQTIKKFGLVSGESLKLKRTVTRGEMAEWIFKLENSGTVINGAEPSITIEILSPENQYSEIEQKLIDHPKFPILLDAWKQIHEKYVDKENIDEKKLVYGAVKGMVKALNDSYSTFVEPEEQQSVAIENEFDGVGIIIELIEEKVKVVAPLKDTPAEQAGIAANDTIIKVDDKEVKGLPLEQVASMIRGKAGTNVKLTIQRDGKTLDFTVTRAKIKITPVKYTMLDNQIAYIEIVHFSQDVDLLFASTLQTAFAEKARGFIVDLRNNPGGFLEDSLRVLEYFVPKGKIMSSVAFHDGNKTVYTSNGPGTLSQYPLAILINKGSASASEIVAGAVKDHGIAPLIGEQTFGKGTVQELISYLDGSVLKLTVAKWLTPAGTNLVKEGIKPTIEVARTDEDRKADRDPQKDRAIEELLKKIK